MSKGNNKAEPVAPAMATSSTRILNVQKFRGNNETKFYLLRYAI